MDLEYPTRGDCGEEEEDWKTGAGTSGSEEKSAEETEAGAADTMTPRSKRPTRAVRRSGKR